MRLPIIFILFLILSNCSFDNKSGIWTNNNENESKKENQLEGFKTLNTKTNSFNQEISPNKNLKIKLDAIKTNLFWSEEGYNNYNNLENFNFKSLNNLVFKSQKLSRSKTKDKFLFFDQKILVVDDKGNIIAYSVESKHIIWKFNFYKKKYKKIAKELNFIIYQNKIFISDNLGYLYSLNLQNGNLYWAKNYKVPFRSNLKAFKDLLVLADSNNVLYLIDIKSGDKFKTLPTEETILKNNFKNSIALKEDTLFFLNTYGSLYSISDAGRINWFINLNQSLSLDTSSLFNSFPIVIYKNKLIISTNDHLYIIDYKSGSTLIKTPISSLLKPIISGDKLFLITNDNLLVCMNLDNGKFEYSLNIAKSISEFLDIKKKKIKVKSLALANDNILIFLDNSYLVRFEAEGNIDKIERLSYKLSSLPIFINGSIIYLNKNNKIIIEN